MIYITVIFYKFLLKHGYTVFPNSFYKKFRKFLKF